MEYFRCGQVMKTHGIKGDLKVRSLSDFNRFYPKARLYILHNNDYLEVIIKSVSNYGKDYLVKLEGYEDINLVEKFHSDYIYISEEDRHDELDEDTFYFTDLIDKEVYNQENKFIGKVLEVLEYPQAHYLKIDVNGKNKLVPFIDEFIIEVSDKIIINEIEGLI